MQDALTNHKDVISADVALPDQAVIKIRKDTVKVDELTEVVKAAGFTAAVK